MTDLERPVATAPDAANSAEAADAAGEAYGRLRALAPEHRVALAFRALVDERARR